MSWKILVVDDEPNIQEVTALALSRLTFEGAPVALFFASSASSAIQALEQQPDIAVMLLDVVMESDSSGLDLINQIRNERKNHLVRFILRTGQAGVAPESQIIQQYDVQEYWNKVDLTVKRLRNSVISAIRNYATLIKVERRRELVEFILERMNALQDCQVEECDFFDLLTTSLHEVFYASRYLLPLDAVPGDAVSCLALFGEGPAMVVESARGSKAGWRGLSLDALPDAETKPAIRELMSSGDPIRFDQTDSQMRLLARFGPGSPCLYLEAPANVIEPNYLLTLMSHAQTIFRSKSAHWKARRSCMESALRMASIAEGKTGGSESALVRISRQAEALAKRAGCSDAEAKQIGEAAALFDIGAVKIADSVLLKPTALNEAEWATMKSHAALGHELLAGSPMPALRLAAVVALEHHENWDGGGYPSGKKGTEISLGARIASIVSVHDRLMSPRPYRPAWSKAEAVAYLQQEAGRKFDPELIAQFFDIYDQIEEVARELPLTTS